jgi:hypothetical protein
MSNTETLIEKIRSLSPHSVDEVLQFVENVQKKEKFADPNRKPFSRHFGSCPDFFAGIDPVAYQRSMRD